MNSRLSQRIVMLFIILVLSMSSALPADLSDGLVGYWSFDDGTATDNSGNGNNGTIYGATGIEGILGQALSFDGVDDYVDIGRPLGTDPQLDSDWSYCAWIYPNNLTAKQTILGNSNYEQSYGTAIDVYDGYARVFKQEERYLVKSKIDFGWHHVVGTYNMTTDTITLFVDSIARGVAYSSLNDGGGYMRIGALINNLDPSEAFGNYFQGIIDEVRIYNRPLSCSEVGTLYEQVFNIADFTHDGTVDISDLATLANEWLNTENTTTDILPDCGDGIVNLLDFAELVENWLD